MLKLIASLLLLSGCATPQETTLAKLSPLDVTLKTSNSSRLAAWVNPPDKITVTKALADFVPDDEFAAVLAHELIHLIRKHDPNIGRNVDYERESDVLGACLLDQAGFNPYSMAALLKRLSAVLPDNIELEDRLEFLETNDFMEYC